MARNQNSAGEAAGDWGEMETRLQRVNQLLAEMETKERRVTAAMGRDVRAVTADVQRLNRTIEDGATDALEGMLTHTRRTRQAMEQIWTGFARFFAARVVRGLAGALAGIMPSPGGIFGSLVGGLLGLFGLQEGGLVRGTREGRPFVLGENFTDELVVPLKKLGVAAGDLSAAPAAAAAPPPEVNVYPQFIVENRAPLEADLTVYRLAEKGRVRLAGRTLTPAPTMEEGS